MDIRIVAGGRGFGDFRVWLDGTEVSSATTAVSFEANANDYALPLVTLTLLPRQLEIDGAVKVVIERLELESRDETAS